MIEVGAGGEAGPWRGVASREKATVREPQLREECAGGTRSKSGCCDWIHLRRLVRGAAAAPAGTSSPLLLQSGAVHGRGQRRVGLDPPGARGGGGKGEGGRQRK